ncbi:hypothetical protein NC651_037551 [Populus alba x Populus x berolinensis]|nr:hypothetical protein NC651_037551 [Populus alba x Populus x berolinensis]
MVEKRWDSEKGRGDFVGKYLEEERLCMGKFVMVKKVLEKERNGVQGLQFYIMLGSLGFRKMILKVDSQETFRMVREGNSLFHPYDALVADINELLNSTWSSDADINELVVSLPKVFSYLRVLQALHVDAVVFVS